ncbi:hypothetical protein ET445_13895 [Agromyces protaetiae]|uniref:VWA domain-containing protein n=1 Tax=Agromyces protaetiae TaxID=2509455 RepID=A0A4P6FEB8_9MICO|nr:hypothetical protein [Agromyces protaetiae]QAY74255.1 hypothetical protein ET445_13895 [Agromyces protaetiae]
MTFSVSRRALKLGITATALVATSAALAGCSTHASGDLGRLQAVLATCPTDQQLNVYDAVDGTGTTRDDQIAREYLKYLEADVEKAAVCGGHVSIVAFGTNSVTAPIYEADLSVPGSTDIARLRRVPDVVAETMKEVAGNYQSAIELLPQGGTDVTGLLRLLGEARDLRPDLQLQATILTDGLTNQGVVINHELSDAEATSLADSVSVPDLSGATVSVVGIGRVAGDPLSSGFIEGLKAFYTRLCGNANADKCLVVTDGR